jgi:hypothetical protein
LNEIAILSFKANIALREAKYYGTLVLIDRQKPKYSVES